MARREYSNETKAACLAALLGGQSVGEVAATYSVPAATLRSWKSRQGLDGQGTVALVTESARAEIGDLLLVYLRELIEMWRKQLVVFGDPEWLKKQSAGELAVLHGVAVDKGIRLLEALEAGGEGGADATPGQVRSGDGEAKDV
jgi:transposase-like protein